MSRPMTLAEKILARSAGRPAAAAGEILWAEPDVAMMDDPLGPNLIQEGLERLGGRLRHPERVVVISDHCAPPANVAHANLLKVTRQWAKRYQIARFHEFEGICHQLMVEEGYVRPGQLVVGTDSHTVMGGALGAFATGIGSTEMLGVLVTGEMWFRVPATVRVRWEGRLPFGVMAKDLILHLLGQVGPAGLNYQAVEFCGSAVDALPMDERFCLTNMVVEGGAKAGLIPPDQVTREWLQAVLDPVAYAALEWLEPDPEAGYARELVESVDALTPQVATPGNPANAVPVAAVEGVKVDQAYLGGCAGGRLSDLAAAASLLRGRRVAEEVRLIVCPASRRVWQQAMASGVLQTLYEAGAIITAPGCGACGGGHSGILGDGEVAVSSTNRNFPGRMGSGSASIYLASALTVAAAALTGRLTDPRAILQP